MTQAMTGAWIVPVRDVQVASGTQANCGGIAAAAADFEPCPELAVDSNAARNREAGRLLVMQAVRRAAAQNGQAETG